MSKILLAQLFNPATGRRARLSAVDIYDVTRKKTLDQVIDAVLEKLDGVSSNEEVDNIKTELTQLKATFQTFMTGEDDDNGALDRLKELVAAIQANKSSIDALLRDKATKAELEAALARVAALEGKNWTLLDGLGTNADTGNLTFNGKELTGETGIAICTSPDAEAVYNGKLKIVLQELDTEEPAEAGA